MLDLHLVWPSVCNKKCLPPSEIVSGGLFPWIVWALWKARNRYVFEGFLASPEDTLSSAIVLAREWSDDSKPEKQLSNGRKFLELPPTHGATVVRSDAAWNSDSKTAGMGWALLAQPQTQSFQKVMEFVSSPLMAEGLALREAVATCRRLELKALRFESDSAPLIKSLNSNPRTRSCIAL